jgi:hypothetical protein
LRQLAQLNMPEGFTVVAQTPFVVIGDERPSAVAGYENGQVRR